MHVALVTIGTRGDVQPFVALGRQFIDQGHQVTLATHGDFEKLVREAGLAFAELPGSPRDLMEHPALLEALREGASLIRAQRKVPKPTTEQVKELVAAVAAAVESADLVVTSVLSRIAYRDDGSVPCATLCWWPIAPTSRYPAMMFPQVRLGPFYNRLTHQLAGLLDWAGLRTFNRIGELPPPPFGNPYKRLGRDMPLLCPVSRAMFSEPPDWPARARITGHWFWDREWSPSPELAEFVESGESPVTLAFGSIWPVLATAEDLTKVINLVRRTGRRVVMVGGPQDVPNDVFRTDDVHYPWLFPRSAAVIHHGSVGTTAEALRAGVPQVLVPTFNDGPFWAVHTRRLGVAAEPVPFTRFSHERLEASLRVALTDDSIRRRAEAVGLAVRAERGTENAVRILDEWVRDWHDQRASAGA
jgi:UDP:flavonoid glycosyltransferase YjiC (YdhE family)